jgi:hypothetical protein
MDRNLAANVVYDLFLLKFAGLKVSLTAQRLAEKKVID